MGWDIARPMSGMSVRCGGGEPGGCEAVRRVWMVVWRVIGSVFWVSSGR